MHWDQKQELWLPVKDYEGLYEVSNLGRVKSLVDNHGNRRVEPKILKAGKMNRGYLIVALSKSGISKTFRVHRLVAQAFLDNPLNLPQVNHKDCNPLNNRAENLEFCDTKYNCNYGSRNKKIAVALSKTVLQYTLDGELVREWPSTAEAGRSGFEKNSVAACCRGEYGYKTHKGYLWAYKEQP